jgi:hypothetical protein
MNARNAVRAHGWAVLLANGWFAPVLPQKEQLERMFDFNRSKLPECAYPLAECA